MIIVAFISSDLRLLPWKSNFQSVDSLSRVHTQKMWKDVDSFIGLL
jgi:hypothetical protein